MDRRAVAQVCVDVVATGLLIAADQGIDYLEPVKRGFWCSDDSIAYPKQDETVPYQMLIKISMILPVVFLIVSEILYAQISRRNKLFLTSQEFWYHLITVLFSWAFCFWLCKAITGFAKVRVGRLRPVFLDYCKPNIDCSDPIYANKYITNYTCSVGHSTENFIRTSFPSGHSSESMVSMVFIIIYLWKRYCMDSARYFVALIQLVPLFIGLFVSLSRIYDNIHHWSDVLAGMAVGTAVAFIGALLPGRLERLKDDSDDNKGTTASSATFRSFA